MYVSKYLLEPVCYKKRQKTVPDQPLIWPSIRALEDSERYQTNPKYLMMGITWTYLESV